MDKDTLILVLVIVHLVLHFLPRPYMRKMRRELSRFVMWQWRKMSKLSAIAYWWLYEKVNSNNNGKH